MSILHVRNVPDELYLRLKRRAKAQRRSLSAEVLILLEWAVQQAEHSPEIALTSIRRRRFFDPAATRGPGPMRSSQEINAEAALALAVSHQITAYDAAYVALARPLALPLVTADEALVRRLARTDLDVRWLGEWPL